MNWKERITIDPKILVGKPIIRGTRMAVEFIVELLAEGWTHEQIIANYPQLSDDDIEWENHFSVATEASLRVISLP